MSVVVSKLRFGVVGSLLLGGCLLSFFVGRWSLGDAPVGESQEARLSRLQAANAPAVASARVTGSVRSEDTTYSPRSQPRAQLSAFEGQDVLSGALLERQASELSKLAETDPQGALALAGSVRFRADQLNLKRAALEGWARNDPVGAARAAFEFDPEERESALLAVLQGAAISPENAFEALRLMVEEGGVAGAALHRAKLSLVGSLSKEGHFDEAVEFALQEENVGQRAALTEAGFAQWARYEPEAAVSMAMEIDSREERDAAFSVATATWSSVDPGGLARFADELPQSKERAEVMKKALQQWVAREPTAAAEWMESREPAAELDTGVLALATHPFLAERSPRVAVSWAESLWDENLRADTLALVVKQWAATDRRAAIEYVRESSEFPLADRQELLALFGEAKEFGIDGPLER